MSEWRVYAATTGRCLTGQRSGDYSNEQTRVRQDFASGVRLVVNEKRGEIRGFVPVDRGSQEAFIFTVSFSDEEDAAIQQYLAAVEECIDERDRWQIRYETPEGRLLQWLNDAVSGTLKAELVDDIDQHRCVGVPGYEAAVTHLVKLHLDGGLSTPTTKTSIISLSDAIEHIDYDILIHVSRSYDSSTVTYDK